MSDQTPKEGQNKGNVQTSSKLQSLTSYTGGQGVRSPIKNLQTENLAIQKELQSQDTQVRKKVHELNSFIKSVKTALEDKNLETLDQLIQDAENPKDTQFTNEREERERQLATQSSKNFKVIDGREKNTISYQGKNITQGVKVLEKSNEKQPQTSEDLAKLLQTMHTLLEKNLQESTDLKHQLKSPAILNGLHNAKFKNQKSQNDNLIEINENQMDLFNEEISDSEKQLNQLQIQRLLTKIQGLNQKIQDLELQMKEVLQNEQVIRRTMLSSFCVSSVDYIEISSERFTEHMYSNTHSINSLPLQKILIKIQKNSVLLSSHDVDDQLTFKTIHSKQIRDVFYPDREKHFLAVIYQAEEMENESQMYQEDQALKPSSLYSLKGQQMVEFRGNNPSQGLQVLLFKYENQDDLEKWDLALWSICRRSLALNQNYLFENEMFERPFYDEFSVFDYGNQDLDRLRHIVEGVIQQKDPDEILRRTLDMEKQRQKTSQIPHQSQMSQSLKAKISVITTPKQSKIESNLQQSQIKVTDSLKVKLTPRSVILQSSVDEQSKIYRAIALLKSGFCVIKYSSNQLRPNQRVIYLLDNELTLKWKEPLKAFERSKSANKVNSDSGSGQRSIQLWKVKSIKDYAEGPGFAKFRKQREGKENLAITIQADRNLEFDASSLEEKTLIYQCLNLALLNPAVKKLQTKQ